MKEESLRIFFAITLDEEIRSGIANYIEHLKQNSPIPIRWVKESQLHLTLRFLGDTLPKQLEEIYHQALILEKTPSFELTLRQIIAFPEHKPRIIGINFEQSKPLLNLVETLETELNNLGFEPEERTFLPHITIGRIAKPRKKMLHFDELKNFPTKQKVEKITLFKSQLTPAGSIYTVLKEFHLK